MPARRRAAVGQAVCQRRAFDVLKRGFPKGVSLLPLRVLRRLEAVCGDNCINQRCTVRMEP